MKRVGLTGGIATGKSVVRAELERLGVPTIDADIVARDVVAPGTSGLTAILGRFGTSALEIDGTLDGRKLGSIVFADEAARRDLEEIVHPKVKAAIDTWLDSMSGQHNLAGASCPLLYEPVRELAFDVIVTTACSSEEQLRRVMTRDSLSEPQARQRINAQLATEEKVRRGDYAIWTDGTHENTKRQVVETLEQLARRGS